MNQTNLLQKLAPIGVGAFTAISFIGITATSVQAVSIVGSLEWTDGTSDFIDEADDAFDTVGDTFNVIFSDLGTFASDFATGDFDPFFGTPPQAVGNVLTSGSITFENIELVPTAPGFADEAIFETTEDSTLLFVFDTGSLPNGSPGPVTARLEPGATFLGELKTDGAVEFELDQGEWEFDGPAPFDPTMAFSSVFEFGQDAGSPRGTYDASGSTRNSIPEPASILGLLAVGSLGIAMKCKK